MSNGTVRTGMGDIPANLQALLDAQAQAPSSPGRQQSSLASPGRRTERQWSITMSNGTVRTGMGDIPANLQALLDAQARAQAQAQAQAPISPGRQQSSPASPGRPIIQRKWSIAMPNGTVRKGSGDIPADLQALLEAQRASGGLRTQSRWSVSLPDGSKRSGVGDIPADVQALMARGQRRWRVRMPNGTMRSGRGAIPADLTALMEALTSGSAAAGNSLSRSVVLFFCFFLSGFQVLLFGQSL